MQQDSIWELDRVEKKKDFAGGKDVRAVSRLLLFLPKLIFITLIACLIHFLAGLIYYLVQYYLTGKIPYFLPEASQVINSVRSWTGLLVMGTVLAIIVFVFAFRVIFEKKHEILNAEQAKETEGSKRSQAIIEIEKSETPEKAVVVPLPSKKKAFKKVYGKCKEQEESKNEEKFPKKNKTIHERKGCCPDNNSGQRGNVVMFKQRRPTYRRRAYRSNTSRMATAANRIKWSTQMQSVNQT